MSVGLACSAWHAHTLIITSRLRNRLRVLTRHVSGLQLCILNDLHRVGLAKGGFDEGEPEFDLDVNRDDEASDDDGSWVEENES